MKLQSLINGSIATVQYTHGCGACFFRAIARAIPKEEQDALLREYAPKLDMHKLEEDYKAMRSLLEPDELPETILAYVLRQIACDLHATDLQNIAQRAQMFSCSAEEAKKALEDKAERFRKATKYAENQIILSLSRAIKKDVVIIRPATTAGEYRVTRVHYQTSDQHDQVIKSDEAFVVYYNGTNHYEYVEHDGSFSQLNDGDRVYASEDNEDTKANDDFPLLIDPMPNAVPQPVSLVTVIFQKIYDFINKILDNVKNTVHAVARALKIKS